jgi:hypothetical protein
MRHVNWSWDQCWGSDWEELYTCLEETRGAPDCPPLRTSHAEAGAWESPSDWEMPHPAPAHPCLVVVDGRPESHVRRELRLLHSFADSLFFSASDRRESYREPN